jgi:L,D-peptidoglycan transpeptidase YkuD (ErfK/YbiS/YcfS/YnhG family)
MDIVVTPIATDVTRGTLRYKNFAFPCALGRTGVRVDKHEGDGATPVGRYALKRVLYRADKLMPPATKLPISPIAKDDGWCDAPEDPNYNRPVKLPYPASAENMWREDALYDLVVVLGHNDDPVVPHGGSAIFMHVAAPDFTPTAGCIALAREDLLSVLRALPGATSIEIREKG